MPRLALSNVVLALVSIGLLAAGPADAQSPPADGYIGPPQNQEPAPMGAARSGRGPSFGNWETCAREGERCTVRGWGVVRYGADGSYVYREVRNATLNCDNSMFGDPAPRRSKRCEVRLHDGGGGGPVAGQWRRCASEGETCHVSSARARVRYGVEGRYYEREVGRGPLQCNNQTFGDPAPRQTKHCDIIEGRPGGGGGGGGQWGGHWEHCAREGRDCVLPGPATVRYGVEGRYTFRRFQGGRISCDNRSFGDPAVGASKYCDYQLDGGFGNDWGGHWVYCAREDERCEFRGARNVRYAAEDGRHVVRRFRNGVQCSNSAFGVDPAPRVKKFCVVEQR